MEKILAIDFSTTNTGYAFKAPLGGHYVIGSISGGKSKDPLDRTAVMIEQLFEIIDYWAIEDYFVAIEEPIIVQRTRGNISLVRANGYLLGALRLKYNMGKVDVPNASWASYHLITGKRKERKEQSMNILAGTGLVPNEAINDDMADAYCILSYMETQ